MRMSVGFLGITALLALGMAMAAVLMAPSSIVEGHMAAKELVRYGLPAGYKGPENVYDWNGERICVLFPDGELERRASWERITRTLIDRQVADRAKIAQLDKAARELSARAIAACGALEQLKKEAEGREITETDGAE